MLKREKEVPKDLLTYLEQEQRRVQAASFDGLHHFVSYPEREVKMKIVRNTPEGFQDGFYSVIIPAVDVFTRGKSPLLRPGFLKRDALSFFVNGTKEAFPFGHVYRSSGSICLGSLFVPSAVPEYAPAMPLETLFLSNDRNLNHGDGHLSVNETEARAVVQLLSDAGVRLSQGFFMEEKKNLLKNDVIWNLSADVAEQKPLPGALAVMASVYAIIFKTAKETVQEQEEKEE